MLVVAVASANINIKVIWMKFDVRTEQDPRMDCVTLDPRPLLHLDLDYEDMAVYFTGLNESDRV